MYIIDDIGGNTFSLPTKEIRLEQLKSMQSELAVKILRLLADGECYPKELARRLRVHEQKIYYHIRNLERAGLIRVVKKENIQGAVANYYSLNSDSFVIRFKDLIPTQKIASTKKEISSYLDPFIKNGELNAMIIVGSPDPHGPDKARARDGYYGMDLALFFGTFLNYIPSLNVRLDTETKQEDLQNNLILFGGPIVNKVTEKFNSFLPIKFKDRRIYSTLSKESHSSDESALIVKVKNPFNKNKYVLVVAGQRYQGTRAAIIAFLKHFNQLINGNKFNNKIKANIVEGIDLDSDGIVDDVEFRE